MIEKKPAQNLWDDDELIIVLAMYKRSHAGNPRDWPQYKTLQPCSNIVRSVAEKRGVIIDNSKNLNCNSVENMYKHFIYMDYVFTDYETPPKGVNRGLAPPPNLKEKINKVWFRFRDELNKDRIGQRGKLEEEEKRILASVDVQPTDKKT